MKAYGVWHRLGLDAWNIARPALFLIDRSGRIHYSFVGDSQEEFPSPQEISGALSPLGSLRASLFGDPEPDPGSGTRRAALALEVQGSAFADQ